MKPLEMTNLEFQDGKNKQINQKSDSLSAPLKLMYSRISSSPWQVPPGVLTAGFFVFKYKNVSRTSAFVTGKCRIKVKSAGGTCQDGVNMASKWRIDGVFSDMRIEKKGTNFHESRTH